MPTFLPAAIRARLRPIKRAIRNAKAIYPYLTVLSPSYLKLVASNAQGQFPRSCPVCGHRGLFSAAGSPPRWDAQCSECGALERHRLFALALQAGLAPKGPGDILHFAPEPSITSLLKQYARRYVTADLFRPGVDLRLNIEALDLPDGEFDVIFCSHILEHVDDKRALSELNRVLRPGGVMYAMTPIVEGWAQTYEDPSVRSEQERELHFGQHDHIRYYGRDFRDRLTAAGYEVEEFTPGGDICVPYGLMRGETLFVCRKAI